MSCRSLVKISFVSAAFAALVLLLGCANKPSTPAPKPAPSAKKQTVAQRPTQPSAGAATPTAPRITLPPATPTPAPARVFPVMLGIDVLEADGFRAIAGKKVGLLTHPAGVNRRGETTVDVLRRAPRVQLVSLFAPEHGIDGTIKAGENFNNTRDKRTGLPVYALYGQSLGKAKAMVKGLDALVIDLQDIGVRSYTFTVIMRYAMEACFENGVEVVVLDRPNPLGGWKVDGPPLDPEWLSGVGAFPRMPYLHGLTMGEIARLAKFSSPTTAGMTISEKARAAGKLTVIPMRGWTRSMQWPETGLKWVGTSPFIQTYESVIGYAMVGLGTQNSGWKWGIGKDFPFRGISFPKKTPDEIIKAMEAYKIPGITFVKRQGKDSAGKMINGVYVEVTDWQKWNPTELSFYMHKQAAIWSLNPFATLSTADARAFQIHVGSTAWYQALRRDGARVNVPLFIENWIPRSRAYQELTKRYWIYR